MNSGKGGGCSGDGIEKYSLVGDGGGGCSDEGGDKGEEGGRDECSLVEEGSEEMQRACFIRKRHSSRR